MFLVDGLPRDRERLGNLRPTPARTHGLLDSGVLELISHAPQRDHGREGISGILRNGTLSLDHISNRS